MDLIRRYGVKTQKNIQQNLGNGMVINQSVDWWLCFRNKDEVMKFLTEMRHTAEAQVVLGYISVPEAEVEYYYKEVIEDECIIVD